MSKDDLVEKQMNMSLEAELCNINENKLPHVISQRLEVLVKANEAFEAAVAEEKRVREEVGKALKHADELIEQAKNLGSEKPEEHQFLKFTWATKGDRIQCLEENLKTLAKYEGDSANANKELAEVQKTLSDSQTAVLEVQRTQMEYQETVANATKFLYGLCTYSMASTQSIVTNLEAILSGAEKKELGEMAKQQMFLVMDQLKNQENIIARLNETDENIADIDEQVLQHEEKISALERENELLKKYDLLHQKQLKEVIENGKKRDETLQQQIEKDAEKDKILQEQQLKDTEHDRLIAEGVKKDEEQDLLLVCQQEKDRERDEFISALQADDIKQKQEIAKLENRVLELEISLKNCSDSVPAKKVVYITTVVSVLAFLISFISFFI